MTCSITDANLDVKDPWCGVKVPSEKLELIKKKYPESYSGWSCNRPKNHEGKHHAHALPHNDCAATWTQEEAIVEAL